MRRAARASNPATRAQEIVIATDQRTASRSAPKRGTHAASVMPTGTVIADSRADARPESMKQG